MKCFAQLSVVAVAVVLAGACAVQATPIVNSTTFLPGPINIAFDTPVVTPETSITNQYSAFGATFLNTFQGDTGGSFTVPNADAHNIQDFISSGVVTQPLTINFNSLVSAADFALAQKPGTSEPGTSVITSFLNGVQQEQFHLHLRKPFSDE